jgi:hypothetical protein
VIALEDPGVPNWLDPGEFRQGTVIGRWFECDSHPLPTLTKVPLADLRAHIPGDTPLINPAERERRLRQRVRSAQLRRRW